MILRGKRDLWQRIATRKVSKSARPPSSGEGQETKKEKKNVKIDFKKAFHPLLIKLETVLWERK